MLERVNLPDLAERFGGFAAELDWAKVLSVDAQRRVAFARVLLVEPRYAILDEATSALDVANEDSLYQLLAGSTTTLISVGHRPSILKYYPQVLELTGNGECGNLRPPSTATIWISPSPGRPRVRVGAANVRRRTEQIR